MQARYLIDIFSMFNAPRKGPDIELSPASKGVSRIHWLNDMGTIFFPNDAGGIISQTALSSGKCNDGLRTGYRAFFGHGQWHTDAKDFDSSHTHFFNENVNMMPPEDLRCFLKNIKGVERDYGLCADGKTECLLSESDFNFIQSEYSSYYEQEKRSGNIKYSVEFEENILLDVGATVLNSFINTLVNRYLRPWLIDRASERNISSDKVILTVDILSSLTIAIYTGSLKQSLSYALAVKCLSGVLRLAGIDSLVADSIASGIGVYCFSVRNPASLVNINRGNCVIAGQLAGHALIRCLPKLKYEKPPEPVNDGVDKADVINPEPHNDYSGGGMRRRG